MGKRTTPAWERVLAKTERRGDCLVFVGSLNKDGYGIVRVSKTKTRQTHRVAWEAANGPIPDGLWVLHTCDNPPCVEPSHLYVGTHLDNVRDMLERKRHRGQKQTHCIHGHALAGENLIVRDNGTRACRICRRRRKAESAKRNRETTNARVRRYRQRQKASSQ